MLRCALSQIQDHIGGDFELRFLAPRDQAGLRSETRAMCKSYLEPLEGGRAYAKKIRKRRGFPEYRIAIEKQTLSRFGHSGGLAPICRRLPGPRFATRGLKFNGWYPGSWK